MDESKLVKLLGASAKKETSKEMGAQPPCSQFGDNDYNSYTRGEMSLQDMESFIAHCEECKSCLQEIVRRHEAWVQEKEQRENELLFSKTVEFLDAPEKKENLLDIVIKTARKAVEIVSTTGELLQPLQPVIARAADDRVESEPFRIIKEFANPPLSVQVTIAQGETAGHTGLIISLFDPKADDFLSSKTVSITAPGEARESVSNDSGEVYFDLNRPGVYLIAIGDKKKPEARLTVNILNE